MDFKTFVVWVVGLVCTTVLGLAWLMLKAAEIKSYRNDDEKKVNQ